MIKPQICFAKKDLVAGKVDSDLDDDKELYLEQKNSNKVYSKVLTHIFIFLFPPPECHCQI